MNAEVLKKVELWKTHVTEKELADIEKMSEKELEDAFGLDIAFGTAGLRGIVGMGTNRMNEYIVRKTTVGFMNFMVKEYPNALEKGCVIAYDCRRGSVEFSKAAAQVLATNGMKVYLFKELRPTPELSFAVRHLKCAGGIMITASHNPPAYNGYKVYDNEGCQLIPHLADAVTKEVNGIKKSVDLIYDYFSDADISQTLQNIFVGNDNLSYESALVSKNGYYVSAVKLIYRTVATLHLAKLRYGHGRECPVRHAV